MTLPVVFSAGSAGYNLTNSLRFRASASAYLSRTIASNGSSQTFTISTWVKRGSLGAIRDIVTARQNGLNNLSFRFTASDTLELYAFSGGSSVMNLITTQVFRDPSAYYHFVFAVDTTQATSSNRVKFYVNGTQITAFGTATYPSQNATTLWNQTAATHYFGTYDGSSELYDGYMTEVNVVDGQALTPSSFGETSATTGVWIPKKYTGTYGTNGFYLPFTNNSTTTTLGNDFSGNGNNWTTNNISLTSGATYDSMTDVPTLTSATAANYSVWNPINNGLGVSPSFANMRLSGVSNVTSRINSTIGVSSGKWYFEATLTTADAFTSIGIGQNNITNQYPGNDALSYAQTLEQATSINNNTQPSYGTAFSSGDVFMCAFDLDTNKLFFGRNGTWFGSSNPATGTNPVYTLTAGTYNVIARPNPSGFSSNAVLDINFGQRPFAYTPPTGFNRLNTFNLPTPTIGATASTQADDYFNAVLYSGNNSTQNIAVGFQPDFVWSKCRNVARSHRLSDAVRGSTRDLYSDTTGAEQNDGSITSFISTGFSLNNATGSAYNTSGENYVSWAWKANGAGSTNTAGSIISTVSANTTAGFSVVTYTGNGTTGSTVGHGLGVAPAMILPKVRSRSGDSWHCYHSALGGTQGILLNATNAASTDSGFWNNTNPNSSVFTVGTYNTFSSQTYVAYCFAPVAGYSAFGSYTGNGSTDGPFIYTGFRPRFILIKNTTAYNWQIWDTSRSPYNQGTTVLFPNLSNADNTTATQFDILSNGFKIRTSDAGSNGSGNSIIYAAFAESPFKYANAR